MNAILKAAYMYDVYEFKIFLLSLTNDIQKNGIWLDKSF